MNIKLEQIKLKLGKLPLSAIAKKNKFICQENKLTAISFVFGFFDSFLTNNSIVLNSWAQSISLCIGSVYLPQSLCKRLMFRCQDFCQDLLEYSISLSLLQTQKIHKAAWLSEFDEVYIEDSSCIKLPDVMLDEYGGGKNKYGHHAITRLQVLFSLKREGIEKMSLHKYSENDQSYADKILKILRPNGLIIRDLGYFVPTILEKINDIKAFFISRWDNKTRLLCQVKSHKWLDLAQLIRYLDKKQLTQWEGEAKLGLKLALPVRLILLKLPSDVAEKKQAAAQKKAKDKQRPRTDTYFEYLNWVIIITNVPNTRLNWQQILDIYRLRWRIEIIFKAWKSHLNLEKIFVGKEVLNPCHITIQIYLILIWITLFLVPAYNYFTHRLHQAQCTALSLAKFTAFYRKNYQKFVNELESDYLFELIKAFCTYDKRKDSPNYFEKIYIIDSC